MPKTTQDLLKDYIAWRSRAIAEFSTNRRKDLVTMVNDAKAYARDLGIEWKDDFVDGFDWDCIRDYEYDVDEWQIKAGIIQTSNEYENFKNS